MKKFRSSCFYSFNQKSLTSYYLEIFKFKFKFNIQIKGSQVVGDVCYGDWRWPPGCRDCDYRISWNYLDDTDEIEFSIETRAPSNWWTGVGFSPTGAMANFHNRFYPPMPNLIMHQFLCSSL